MLQALKSKEMHKLCNSSDTDLWAQDQHKIMESLRLEELSRIRVQPVTDPYLDNHTRALSTMSSCSLNTSEGEDSTTSLNSSNAWPPFP